MMVSMAMVLVQVAMALLLVVQLGGWALLV
jgi:hypothetical protein